MITTIKKLFGLGPKADYTQLLREGAIILDVRTKSEFESGHIRNALNIPLDQLSANLGKLKDKNKPIITCCASGIRSGSAKSLLVSKGFTQVYNGGGWVSLQKNVDI